MNSGYSGNYYTVVNSPRPPSPLGDGGKFNRKNSTTPNTRQKQTRIKSILQNPSNPKSKQHVRFENNLGLTPTELHKITVPARISGKAHANPSIHRPIPVQAQVPASVQAQVQPSVQAQVQPSVKARAQVSGSVKAPASVKAPTSVKAPASVPSQRRLSSVNYSENESISTREELVYENPSTESMVYSNKSLDVFTVPKTYKTYKFIPSNDPETNYKSGEECNNKNKIVEEIIRFAITVIDGKQSKILATDNLKLDYKEDTEKLYYPIYVIFFLTT
jgi:hypothetical protein